MAGAEEKYLSAYLFAGGTSESYLNYAHELADTRGSGVHFVFPLVGAWDSMTVLEAAPGDLEAIRRLVIDLTGPQATGVDSSTPPSPSRGRRGAGSRSGSRNSILGRSWR